MTSDSHLFRTAAQLDAEGFYPVQGNRWKRGEELYLPLYEGKMVQAIRPSSFESVIQPRKYLPARSARIVRPKNTETPVSFPQTQYWVIAIGT